MGGPYNIPRNYKGESKILFIFSMKSFIFTVVGAFIGIIFYYVLKLLKLSAVGIVLIVIFALIGFAIGTFKIPDTTALEFTKKVGGESIDIIFLRWLKFKRNNKKIYIYIEEETKDVK